MSGTAFDVVASTYDTLWTDSAVGRSQRAAVWRHIDPLFEARDAVLDLGCGTGEDAIHLMRAGVAVRAIDSSAGMVQIAARRGVDATLLPIENVSRLGGVFDGAISNFGALNCVEDLDSVRGSLAGLIRPGGHLAICIMGRVCLWETVWYLMRGQARKAFRRWGGESHSSTFDWRIFYPGARCLRQTFAPDFELRRWHGIGLTIPPSYVPSLPRRANRFFDALDRQFAHRAGLRALADHRLFIFVRK